eukprot:TRINITY_DN139_c1_g5_i2.p1 TRINITY_DN139_c1_g5~~TRINITY_DN139_c1_g5_i2.p1  ORF type:complete len:354 (+),score=36.27 TRINITY_DN139_c1_g5_i2:564-1625(+)
MNRMTNVHQLPNELIANFYNIRKLELISLTMFEDFPVIRSLHRLQQLKIVGCKIKNLNFLTEDHKELWELYVKTCFKLVDISSILRNQIPITSLFLFDIGDIQPHMKILLPIRPNIKTLVWNPGAGITMENDLSFLKHVQHLEIFPRNQQITLSLLTNLVCLTIINPKYAPYLYMDLDNIANLINLQYLKFETVVITGEFDQLHNLNLNTLILKRITGSLNHLNSIPSLTHLDVEGYSEKLYLRGAAHLKKLRILGLNYCIVCQEVFDIIGTFEKLEYLYMNNCSMINDMDISMLGHLENLRDVQMKHRILNREDLDISRLGNLWNLYAGSINDPTVTQFLEQKKINYRQFLR